MATEEWIAEVPPELARSLADDFSRGPVIRDDGIRYLTEETVARLNGLKIQVFSNEHPPPHFRVVYGGETANFSIKDCTRLNGGLDRWLKNIRIWHMDNKQALIDAWNSNRPSDCPVGIYRE
jgi:hypothetical protein